MEDILDIYQAPYDAQHPLVCMDESNKQLLGEVREPLPLTPETPMRYDANTNAMAPAICVWRLRRCKAGGRCR